MRQARNERRGVTSSAPDSTGDHRRIAQSLAGNDNSLSGESREQGGRHAI